MNWFLTLPLSVRTWLVGLIGLLVGGQINHAIYRLAWHPRPIGPWSPPHPKAPARKWWDRIPIIGWFGLAREEEQHGTLFWFRPLAIEVFAGVGLAMFYQWHVNGGLHDWMQLQLPVPMPSLTTIHAQFLSHAILFALLLAASFIDFDEKTIPDTITIPGTLMGLVLAALLPQSLLPSFTVAGGGTVAGGVATPVEIKGEVLTLTSPFDWQVDLMGTSGLLIGLACVVGWWYALLPKTLWFRSGIVKAVKYLLASMWRHAMSKRLTLWLLLPGLVAVLLTWRWGGDNWKALLTSLVGMAFGGGLVWAFRVVASTTLRQEALGFGDVTLMGMIGAFVGWQPSLLVFFLAPFAGVGVAVAQWVITRRHEIAYGPYLCLATVILILFWNRIWARTWQYFFLGLWIPVGLLLCLVAMAVMLSVWMQIKRSFKATATD